jgi:KDO2-lipid IV(A) lauroyltransferase
MKSKLMSGIFYSIFYASVWLFTLIPLNILYVISDFFSLVLQYIIRYRKKVVRENLSRCFPEKSEKEINAISRKFYSYICDFAIESLKTIHLSKKQVDRRFKYENLGILEELYNKNKDITLVSGHYGNWEWIVNFPEKISHRFLATYRPLRVKSVDKIIHDIRSKYGVIMIPVKETYKEILKYKQKNEHIMICSLIDQRPPRRNKYWTKFMNQETPFYTGFEKIAIKLNMAVVFMIVRRVKRGYYKISFNKLFEDTSGLPDFVITEKIIKILEDSIIVSPEYWLWSHKRWKHKLVNEDQSIKQ